MNTNNCVNFRDVGEYINFIANKSLLPLGRLYRGGKLNYIQSLKEIKNPKTILNLRKGKDLVWPNAKTYHIPTENLLEVYDTTNKKVRRWLNNVIRLFQSKQLAYPVFIHCTSGKDRTGVVVAALLTILDIPQHIIIEEYLLSEGEVKCNWIMQALRGIQNTANYFNRVDIQQIKTNILKPATN